MGLDVKLVLAPYDRRIPLGWFHESMYRLDPNTTRQHVERNDRVPPGRPLAVVTDRHDDPQEEEEPRAPSPARRHPSQPAG